MSAVAEGAKGAETSTDAEEAKFLWPPLMIAVVLLWLLPLGTSLGLDETGAWWVVKDGWREAVVRNRLWPGSVLFDFILVAVRAVAGDSDVAMRIPSVLAMLGALFLLYKLATRLLGRAAAMFSCLVFVTLRDVVYVASTVRPYALGLLFVIAAMLALVNWLDYGRFRYGAAYCIFAALTMHASYLLGVMFLVHALYIGARIRVGSASVRVGHVLLVWLAAGTLMLPLLPAVVSSSSGSMQHIYLDSPQIKDVLQTAVPPLLAGAAGMAVLLWCVAAKPVFLSALPKGMGAWLIAWWTFIPPATIFVLSVATPLKLFAERYYIAYTPGLALMAGAVLNMIGPRALRLTVAAALTVSAVLVFDVNEQAMRGTTDWRGAAAAVRTHIGAENTPVIGVPGFHEGYTLEGIADPAISDAIFAPYLRYSWGGDLVRVPGVIEPKADAYLEKIVESLSHQREFFVAGLFGSEYYQMWLRGRTRPLGFSFRYYGNYGGVEVMLFTREHNNGTDSRSFNLDEFLAASDYIAKANDRCAAATTSRSTIRVFSKNTAPAAQLIGTRAVPLTCSPPQLNHLAWFRTTAS